MDNSKELGIGKHILESLTAGMYKEPLHTFREYVQNSRDSLHNAIVDNIIEEKDAIIKITINTEKKIISIFDNGIGISTNSFVKTIGDIANSKKNTAEDAGFRGIGHLIGLGFCDKLVFRSKYKGELEISEITYDAKNIINVINSPRDIGPIDLLEENITTKKEETTLYNNHFFEVILYNASERLLNIKQIKDYLSYVSPVPFSTEFIFSSKILDYCKNNNIFFDTYKITVNDEQIFKKYKTGFFKNNKRDKDRELTDIIFFPEHLTKDSLFWSWLGIQTKPSEQIPPENKERNIRLRLKNIQIDDGTMLKKLFPEERAISYFVGEIYIISNDLKANSQRDYFNANETLSQFENEIRTYFKKIWSLCRKASDIKSNLKKIDTEIEEKEKLEGKLKKGFVSEEEKNRIIENINIKTKEAEKAKNKLKSLASDNIDPLTYKILKNMIPKEYFPENETKNLNNDDIQKKESKKQKTSKEPHTNKDAPDKPKKKKNLFLSDELSFLDKKQRSIVQKIYSIIEKKFPEEYENIINTIHTILMKNNKEKNKNE